MLDIPADQIPMTESTRIKHFLEVRDAERAAVSQHATLLRSDGQPLYTDHEDRVRVIWAERDQVAASKQELCFKETKEAQAWIDHIDASQANPIPRLDPDALARAANLRTFIEADIRRFPVQDLAPQVEAALAGGDVGQRAAWWHALVGRVAELDAAVAAGEHRAPAQMEDRQQLTTMVDRLVTSLRDPELDKQREKQVRRQDSARQLLREINELTQERRVDELAGRLRESGQYARL